MSDHEALIERSGAFKRALLQFSQSRRYRREFQKAVRERFGEVVVGDEAEVQNFFDYFILQHRLADGRTLVDHFVAEHPELSGRERAMLLGWQDLVDGIFVVERREGNALIVVNLVDELTYRVRSNMGPAALAPMRPNSFLIARLVPVDDEWLLSGISHTLPASSRRDVREMADMLALRRPELAFRNPEKLERAWELQRKEREDFISFFGADQLVIPGHELQERLQAYHHFLIHERRDAEGRTSAERAEKLYGAVPETPSIELDPNLVERETVGVIFDEVEGMNFFPDFGLVQEAFAAPELVSEDPYHDAVLSYLESPGIAPLPLRRLAERDPEHASQVFRQVLRQPTFDWNRDGEELFRRYKPNYVERAPLPSVVPVSASAVRERLAGTQATTTPSRERGRKSGRRGRKPRQ